MLDFLLKFTIIFGVFWFITVILSPFYFWKGWFKLFYHDVMGWHQPGGINRYHDGCSMHATCKYCGKNIMQDSQGNWFTYD